MRTVSRTLLVSALAGIALTAITGLYAAFGGPLGYAVARIIGFPAVVWSSIAYSLGLYRLTNGLIATPVGIFCFASTDERLVSHVISAFPAFTAVSFGVLSARLAWRRFKSAGAAAAA